MDVYLLEYCEEIEYKDFTAEKYNLIGLYFSESEAEKAKENVVLERKIDRNFLFVSATEIGRLQWEGGFISV